jgi:hypothetical protein
MAARLWINGAEQALEKEAEYPSLYQRFAEIIRAGKSDVDARRCAMSPTPSCSASAKWWMRSTTDFVI